jgi:phosphatidate cytidylyltransferase
VSSRILIALPAIAFAAAIVAYGGLVFAFGLFLVGMLAMAELYQLTARARPVNLAGYLAFMGILLAARYGGQFQMLLILMASVPAAFLLALARPRRENVAWGIAATILGVVWIALPLGHGVLLRELPHGGALVLDVLIGTFVGDTFAYFGGRAWGRRPLAPRISPNKTVEGLIAGIVGGTIAFWGFEVAYQQFMPGLHALIIGFCVALAAPVGDLFESMIKRDLDVKDSGRVFGAHGGALDRLDAIFFTVVVAYYLVIALT